MAKQKVSRKINLQTMRSPCPVASLLDIVGDKWTLLIIRDLFAGKRIYSEFQTSPEGIPTNILAQRLKRLESMGVIDKSAYQQKPVRYQYILTQKGRALGPVLEAMKNWGLEYIHRTSVDKQFK